MFVILPALIFILIAVIIMLGYKKAPPDTAYIVSGLKKRIAIGKAVVRIPFFERIDKLSLRLISIDVRTASAVPTADFINIKVDAVVNAKVGSDPDTIKVAAENFLNQSIDYIAEIAREVLEGNMREIVGRMKLEEMVSDRQKFADEVKVNAAPDLKAMGLELISFNVQNFSDSNGVIDDLGIDNIQKIKRGAAIARAEADKDIAVAQASANRQAEEAKIEAEKEVALRQNELELQKAALKKEQDTARAGADAAYAIQEQEQRKAIEVATANANIAAKDREIELGRKKADVEEQELVASVKKKADADLYKRQQEAAAKKFETEREAEAKKFAKEQEAEGIRLVGESEAAAIRAKGLAEAEAMEKKAEAYQKYTGAAMGEMLIGVLPEIAGKIAEPLQQIDKITIIGGGEENASGVSSVAGNVPMVMSKLFESMKETTGIDLHEIVRAGSYDAKVNRHVTFDGDVTGLPVIGASTGSKIENNEEDEIEVPLIRETKAPASQKTATVTVKDLLEDMK